MNDNVYIVWDDGDMVTATSNPEIALQAAKDCFNAEDVKITIWRNGKIDATCSPKDFKEQTAPKTYRVSFEDVGNDEGSDELLIRAKDAHAAPATDGRYIITADGVEVWFEGPSYRIADLTEVQTDGTYFPDDNLHSNENSD